MNKALISTALLALAFSVGAGCDRGKDADEQQAAESSQETSDEAKNESAQGFEEPDCTASRSRKALGVSIFEDDNGLCTVFVPNPLVSGDFGIALSADPDDKTVAAERENSEGNRLYATTGTAQITVEGQMVRGTVEARDDNAPNEGTLNIIIEAPAP
jgi:hypothetical protein